jgi:ElaB/YqjD/DUF883 family membrane-anchored ribosome-binding protein
MNDSAADSREVNFDKITADFKVVISDAEELLRATASEAGDKAKAARFRIQESLDIAKLRLASFSEAGMDQAREAARSTDEFVHAHPWKAIGVGAAAGVIVGILISRS